MKLPRDLSGADIVKCLKRLGFTVVRQKGSHARLIKGDKRVTVAMHGFPAGTLQNVVRQAEVTIQDLLDAL